MDKAGNKILGRMLDRLFAGLVSGPNLNCRPHASRQRIDCTQLARLDDLSPEEVLAQLMAGTETVKLTGRVAQPKRQRKPSDKKPRAKGAKEPDEPKDTPLTPEEEAALTAWNQQQGVLGKLRILAEEARTYAQDTGVHVLNLGWPLLSLPPGSQGGARFGGKRILAPIAFMPLEIVLRSGTQPTIEISCRADDVERIAVNQALLAWLEQQTGVSFADRPVDDKLSAWEEVSELVRQVAMALKLKVPDLLAHPPKADAATVPDGLQLRPAPRGDDDAQPAIVLAAVIGLFPMNNQGLLRDTQAMQASETLEGPVASFLTTEAALDLPAPPTYEHATWSGANNPRVFSEERLVTYADPCQARAVRLARTCGGLVIHGPPGTGKSQTITNIIGDHLARGQRVLMVCDKRTALDVVAHRLEHLGLGSLLAVVHDPRQDQRDLYRKLRDQLEALTDAKSDAYAEPRLAKIDVELAKLHAELSAYWKLLMEKDAVQGVSFHELVGQWLATPTPPGLNLDAQNLPGANLEELEEHQQELTDLVARSQRIKYAEHPWKKAAGISLDQFLTQSMSQLAASMTGVVEAARQADATRVDGMPPFHGQTPLPQQGQARTALAERLALVLTLDARVLGRWAKLDGDAVARAQAKLAAVAPRIALLQNPLDAELELIASLDKLNLAEVVRHIGALDSYLEKAGLWYGFIYSSRKSQAASLLQPFGLTPSIANARRVQGFFQGVRARFLLQALVRDLTDAGKGTLDDPAIKTVLTQLDALCFVLDAVRTDPNLAGLEQPVLRAFANAKQAGPLVTGLRQSTARAEALVRLEETLTRTGLFAAGWLNDFRQHGLSGHPQTAALETLEKHVESLEDVLRIQHSLSVLPPWLRLGLEQWLPALPEGASARAALRKAVLQSVLAARLAANPEYQKVDPQRLATTFDRLRELELEKQAIVRAATWHRWLTRQKERLLVGTGSRLNSQGADLRRRLTMRGEQALRLRQVVAVGEPIEGGDPLFDLAPVWLASPETVAQVFPRRALFDVVIFDEASQCRLEEALPVLTRAGRVVIAGDPKQLPPTRFFESTLATSAEEDIETEQQLFEAHQKEIEDLLGAALSLDIQQCYLDVHYRSRNSDLIEFSNQQFYSSRLQAIPGHPGNRVRYAPITLYRVDGTYEERQNAAEAERVGQIVRDLLKRAEPPSIGVACFNLTQRDLIVEKLDELADKDRDFARKLADARQRQGDSSFEGLFVKNLENVQGDERDHIIISTTYGPDAQGKFYRRFGPLGRVGGGRRLNVLVTRARQEVHLVTSIPQTVYRSLPPIPLGQTPGGGWLLFSYLAYAEHLAEEYQHLHEASEDQTVPPPESLVRPTATPSLFAQALGRQLSTQHKVGNVVHWGNDGFCVDVALAHPHRVDDVTLGVLCDGVRFAQAEDPVEWDVFRSLVLESQGWRLHRIWSPHFFRDVGGSTKRLMKDVADFLAKEKKGRS